MEVQTLKGLVYLFLILAGGAAIWILILYLMLGNARREKALIETENQNLKRQLADIKVRIETRKLNDVELLKDITNLLSDI